MKNKAFKIASIITALSLIMTSFSVPAFADELTEDSYELIEDNCESFEEDEEILIEESPETTDDSIYDSFDEYHPVSPIPIEEFQFEENYEEALGYDSNSSVDCASDYVLIQNKLDKVIEQMYATLGDNPDEFDVALYLHDWVCAHVSYDYFMYNAILDGHYDSDGRDMVYYPLIEGHGVCAHYSALYVTLMDRAGVGCKVITSPKMNHAWNLVTINNKNYYVDCTWDDVEYEDIEYYRRYFLNSRDAFDHISYGDIEDITDWMSGKINVYETVETSNDYDDQRFYPTALPYRTFDDNALRPYQKIDDVIPFQGYCVCATDKKVILFNRRGSYGPSISLSDEEAKTRYIYHIYADDVYTDGTTIVYYTRLKNNPSEETDMSYTIDLSEYLTGSCGNNVTWHYLDGVLDLTGSGEMYDYWAEGRSQQGYMSDDYVPWYSYYDQISRINVSSKITKLTFQLAFEDNLTDLYYDGSPEEFSRSLKYPLQKHVTMHFGKEDYHEDEEEQTPEKEISLVKKQKVKAKSLFNKSYKKYSSSDKNVITVSDKGVLSAKKAGFSDIYGLVKKNGKWVKDGEGIRIRVREIIKDSDVKHYPMTKAGQTLDASKYLRPYEKQWDGLDDDGNDCYIIEYFEDIKPTKYTSSNKKVATVDPATGIVTSKKTGTTYITAWYGTGKYAAKYKIKVKVTVPYMSKKKVKSSTGKTYQLSLNRKPAAETVTWTSSNEEAATVDENGKVTLLKYDEATSGKVTITATCEEVEYKSTITVKKPAFEKKAVTLKKKGKTFTPKLKNTKYTLSDCENWESTDENVAVFENGKIRAVGGGTAYLTTDVGGVTLKIKVKVKGKPVVVDPVEPE